MENIKEELKESLKLSPDKIASIMFYLHNASHALHLATTSFAKHKMLDEVYSATVDYKDSICEYLLGVYAPKRLNVKNYKEIPDYSDGAVVEFLKEGVEFTQELCEFADENYLEQLCNLSSELQGIFVKAQYLNTLN